MLALFSPGPELLGGSREITPLDYGAVGDGVADDTAPVQAALGTGRSAVSLAGRTYRLSRPLVVPAGITLLGPGKLSIDFREAVPGSAKAALLLDGDGAAARDLQIEVTGLQDCCTSGVGATSRTGLRISGVEISGDHLLSGIHLVDCSDFEIRGCRIHHLRWASAPKGQKTLLAGIRLTNCSLGTVGNCRIEKVEAAQPGPDAALVTLEESRRVAVLGNVLMQSGSGVALLRSKECVISGNSLSRLADQGIRIEKSSYSIVAANSLTDCQLGISMSGDPQPFEWVERPPGHPLSFEAIASSVIGGRAGDDSGRDSVGNLADGDLGNRFLLHQTSPGTGGFTLDLLGRQTLTDFTLITTGYYNPSGQFPSGIVRVETAEGLTGPFALAASARWESNRPPPGGMTGVHPGVCATGGEARRLALAEPVTARYLRFTGDFLTDNNWAIAEARLNQPLVVHRVRPLAPAASPQQATPMHMVDGNSATAYPIHSAEGSIDLDTGPYPAVIRCIRLSSRPGESGWLPRRGSVSVASGDDPDGFDTVLQTFDAGLVNGQWVLPLAQPPTKRYLRLQWSGLQEAAAAVTAIAEISVDCEVARVRRPAGQAETSRGNLVQGNIIRECGRGMDLFDTAALNQISDNIVVKTGPAEARQGSSGRSGRDEIAVDNVVVPSAERATKPGQDP